MFFSTSPPTRAFSSYNPASSTALDAGYLLPRLAIIKGGELDDLLHRSGDGHQRARGRAAHVYITDVVDVVLVHGRHPSRQTLVTTQARG